MEKEKNSSLNIKILLFIFLFHSIFGQLISEINLIVSGNGSQDLINNEFNTDSFTFKVFVNGIETSCNKLCGLNGDINNITLKFQGQINLVLICLKT